MAEDDREPPWWEQGRAPEPLLRGRAHKHRKLIAVIAVLALAAFVAYFIWVGIEAVSMPTMPM